VTDDRPADAEDPVAPVEEPVAPVEETVNGSSDVHEDGVFPPGRVEEARRALEAVLMVVEEPADSGLLAQLLELPTEAVESILEDLAQSYEDQRRGFQLVRVAGGWRFQSHEDCAPYVERFVLSGQSARLSAAALETLAIVAYKQPISRAQIAAIRGVNVDGVMRTLQQRGYIDEVGRDEGPGLAVLFGTTKEFLERLGLDEIGQLPSLGDFIPGAEVVEALEHGLRPTEDVLADHESADDEARADDHAADDHAADDHAADDHAADDHAADDGPTDGVEPGGPPPTSEE
jgi:segregation and condensation protein B